MILSFYHVIFRAVNLDSSIKIQQVALSKVNSIYYRSENGRRRWISATSLLRRRCLYIVSTGYVWCPTSSCIWAPRCQRDSFRCRHVIGFLYICICIKHYDTIFKYIIISTKVLGLHLESKVFLLLNHQYKKHRRRQSFIMDRWPPLALSIFCLNVLLKIERTPNTKILSKYFTYIRWSKSYSVLCACRTLMSIINHWLLQNSHYRPLRCECVDIPVDKMGNLEALKTIVVSGPYSRNAFVRAIRLVLKSFLHRNECLLYNRFEQLI